MVFSGLAFLLLFLPLCCACYFFGKSIRWRNAVLLVFSLLFYAWGEPTLILVMLFTTLVNYLSALAVDKAERKVVRTLFLVLGVGVSLLALIYFKYAGFFLELIGSAFGFRIPFEPPTMPIGISFYTFQIFTYTIDVYRRKVPVQKNPAHLLLYVSCFPQLIAKAYIRTFLDKTLLEQNDYAALLNDHREYAGHLPKTVYVTNYMDSDFERFCSFDTDADIAHGATEDVKIRCIGMKEWKERADVYGSGADGENYVLDCTWEESDQPRIEITFPAADLSKGSLSFRIADMREDAAEDVSEPEYLVDLQDAHGHTVSIANPRPLYPTLAVQLYKQDVFFNSYEYKHPMQTVRIHAEMFREQDFDDTCVVKMVLILTGSESGQIILDDVGYDSVR